jgi:hypothetical protein
VTTPRGLSDPELGLNRLANHGRNRDRRESFDLETDDGLEVVIKNRFAR